MKLILGSQSKGRQSVLRDAGYDFDVMSPDIDEKSIRHHDPKELTLAIANAKADALVGNVERGYVLILSDQVVVFHGKILEKPENAEEARTFLRGYRNDSVRTVAAVVVVNTDTGERREGVNIAEVAFADIPDEDIETLIRQENVFRWAGAFGYQDPITKRWIADTKGDDDSIIGLPMKLVEKLLCQVSFTEIPCKK